MSRRSICVVLTSPFVLNAFLLNHLRALADDYTVTVCINTQESPVSPALDPRIELLHFSIAREVSLIRDAAALFWLIHLFSRRRFDAVHSLTPKGGLLAMLAARLAGIRHRTHTFTGQVWANRRGLSRAVLKAMDRLIVACATDLHADSPSQAHFLEQQGICRSSASIRVFGLGSISGVDLKRFSLRPGRREHLRSDLGIPADAPVFVFLGRLTREKGVLVLVEAFAQLTDRHPEAWLLFVGPDEGGLAQILEQTGGPHCRTLGLTASPEDYLDASDALCLPSYREGFGTVVIEAAAMALPTIASRIYGLTDAVVDNATGILFSPGDAAALAAAMEKLLDPELRQLYGRHAQDRARAEFSAARITNYWHAYYVEKLGSGVAAGRKSS